MPILLPPHDVTLTATDLSEDTAQDMIAVDKVGHTQALKYEYLIEDTLPSGRVSLLVGPSGSGKTTWFLQLAESWLKGEQILDKAVNRPLVHVRQECKAANCSDTSHYSRGTILHLAADRGAKDTEETMDRVLGDNSPLLSDKSFGFEWQSILNPDSTVEDLYDLIRPTTKILFIEGAATLVDGGKINDNHMVASFLKCASEIAETRDVAIILSVHSPKMKRGQDYRNPRDQILGAVAWSAYSSTLFLMTKDNPDDVNDSRRTLRVMPRNYKDVQYHFAMNDSGRLLEILPPEVVAAHSRLVAALQPDRGYRMKELVELGGHLDISERSVKRYVKTATERSELLHIDQLYYVTPAASTGVPLVGKRGTLALNP